MNMSDFAHALGRGGMLLPHQQQQQQQQQQMQQQGLPMNNINFTPGQSSLAQQQAQAQAQHAHQQQLAAASLHQRMQQQQQQQPQQQPSFQSVSQNQQRMNVGVNPSVLPAGMRQAIGSMQQGPGQLQPQQSSSQQSEMLQSMIAKHGGYMQPLAPSMGGLSQHDLAASAQQQGLPQRSPLTLQQQQQPSSLPSSNNPFSSSLSQQQQQPQLLGQQSSTAPRFDMADFPALTDINDGGKQQQLGSMHSGVGGLSTLAGQLSLSQHQQHQQQQSQDANFVIQSEDFPALGGGGSTARRSAPASSPTSSAGAISAGSSASSILQQRAVGGSGTIGQTTPAAGSSVPPSSSVSQQQQSASLAAAAATAALAAAGQPRQSMPRPTKALTCDKYGLTGLLSVIRMVDPDLNTLALGTDLTTLGLNLNSSEVLYATFGAPCLDVPTRSEPDFVLPFAYYMQPPALKTSHLAKFTLETLFYIFYNMPKDTLQVYAAKELYKREWRYHKELKLWFSRAANAQAAGGEVKKDAAGKEIKDAPTDANTYLYFDINAWERRIFRETHILQPNLFMTEEELTAL